MSEDLKEFYGRIITNSYDELSAKIEANRVLGKSIVLTSGTFDILHLGHCEYLWKAGGLNGDRKNTVLVIGVDSDEKVKKTKGPSRPIVSEVERMKIVCHTARPDYIFLKPIETERWKLIKTVKPDILVISERSDYSEGDISKLGEYCKKIINLPPQAETSTTARIRNLLVSHSNTMKKMFDEVRKKMEAAFQEFEEEFSKELTEGGE